MPNWLLFSLKVCVATNPFSPWLGSGKKGKTLVAIGLIDGTWLFGTGTGAPVAKLSNCPLKSGACVVLFVQMPPTNASPGIEVQNWAKLPSRSATEGTVAGTVSPC